MNVPTATIRVDLDTRERLRRLAGALDRSMSQLLRDLVSDAEDERMLADMNDFYADLRTDRHAWQEWVAERTQWDATLLDGLENESPPPAPPG